MRNANSTCLNNKSFLGDIQRETGRRIRIANDANCFALSEAKDGAGAGASVVFGVILGTGVGGGIIVNGQVITGINAITGEWGHNPLPWPEHAELPGPDCYCGKRGCVETWLSGPGLGRDHSSAIMTSEDIVHEAQNGNKECEATLQRYERRLAKSLASVINILDPDAIVLGGGLSNISRLYENVPTLWGEYIFSDLVSTRLVPARFGDSSGVRGAAWLWGSSAAG